MDGMGYGFRVEFHQPAGPCSSCKACPNANLSPYRMVFFSFNRQSTMVLLGGLNHGSISSNPEMAVSGCSVS